MIHLQGDIDAFDRVSECLQYNIPIIATVGHGRLADFLKFVVDHFATAKHTMETESSSHEQHCFCSLDRTRVHKCLDVKYRLQMMYDDCSMTELDRCLASLSEVL
jgi:hypothetical protein